MAGDEGRCHPCVFDQATLSAEWNVTAKEQVFSSSSVSSCLHHCPHESWAISLLEVLSYHFPLETLQLSATPFLLGADAPFSLPFSATSSSQSSQNGCSPSSPSFLTESANPKDSATELVGVHQSACQNCEAPSER